MKNNATARWLDDHLQQLESIAPNISPEFFPATIHQFRVGSKKLRAVLRFLANDSNYNFPGVFRRQFAKAGEIRDYQAHLQMLSQEKETSLPTFLIWLGYRMGDASRTWKTKKTQEGIGSLRSAVDRFADTNIDEARLWQYYHAYVEWLRNSAEEATSDSRLLEIRRRTKDMLHVIVFCKTILPEAQVELTVVESELQKLIDIAGVYNEYAKLLLAAQRYWTSYNKALTEDETHALAEAETGWSAKHALSRATLINTMKELKVAAAAA